MAQRFNSQSPFHYNSNRSPQSPATGANAVPAFGSPPSRDLLPPDLEGSADAFAPLFGLREFARSDDSIDTPSLFRPWTSVLPTSAAEHAMALPSSSFPSSSPKPTRTAASLSSSDASSSNTVQPPLEPAPWKVPRYLKHSHYYPAFATSSAAAPAPSGSSSSTHSSGATFQTPTKIHLPSRWDTQQCCDLLAVAPDGLQASYQKDSTKTTDKDAAAVRANHPAPTLAGIYYYEVLVVSKGRSGYIGLGFSGPNVSLSRLPGWEDQSYGYHGDDGNVFSSHGTGRSFGPTFTSQDVVGCGIDFAKKRCFFTKNGSLVGHCFQDVHGKLYPSIGLRTFGECVKVNFGQTDFLFDIDQYIEDRKRELQSNIRASPIEKRYLDDVDAAHADKPTLPLDAEDDATSTAARQNFDSTIASLVASYLTFHGHADAAAAFRSERAQIDANVQDLKSGQATASPSDMPLDDPALGASGSTLLSGEEIESVRRRQGVIQSVLSGRHLEAHQAIRNHFPSALRVENAAGVPLDFDLRSRHFLETLLSSSPTDDSSMNIDSGAAPKGSRSATKARAVDTEDASDALADNAALDQILLFGQELHHDYGQSAKPEIANTLISLSSLLAYEDPQATSDPEIQALLLEAGQSGREALAAVVNSAMLASLGKPSRSVLERMALQTAAVRNQLAEEGEGVAAFVDLW